LLAWTRRKTNHACHSPHHHPCCIELLPYSCKWIM
jgi:hypothetical protein